MEILGHIEVPHNCISMGIKSQSTSFVIRAIKPCWKWDLFGSIRNNNNDKWMKLISYKGTMEYAHSRQRYSSILSPNTLHVLEYPSLLGTYHTSFLWSNHSVTPPPIYRFPIELHRIAQVFVITYTLSLGEVHLNKHNVVVASSGISM